MQTPDKLSIGENMCYTEKMKILVTSVVMLKLKNTKYSSKKITRLSDTQELRFHCLAFLEVIDSLYIFAFQCSNG